jgi:hypothetical protein
VKKTPAKPTLFMLSAAFVMRGSGVQIPPAAPIKSIGYDEVMPSSMGSFDPVRQKIDPERAAVATQERQR